MIGILVDEKGCGGQRDVIPHGAGSFHSPLKSDGRQYVVDALKTACVDGPCERGVLLVVFANILAGAYFMARTLCFRLAVAAVAYFLSQPCGLPADADKDPLGWEGLRLGMTFEETLKALGPKAIKAGSQTDEAANNNQYSTAEIKTLAEEILAESKDENSDIPKDIQKLCRAAVKFDKPRKWIHGTNALTATKILGGLNKIQHGCVAINSRQNIGGPIYEGQLDPVSKRFLEDFKSTANELVAFRRERERARHQQDDSFRITRPEELCIAPVEEEGVSLAPSLTFTPHLSRILLHAVYNVVQADKPDTLRAYEAICKRMTKQYGEPDNAMLSETGRKRIWRFPKTVVTVSHEKSTSTTMQYIQTLPNSIGYTGAASSTTMHVYIMYETTESANAQDTLKRGDKLLTGETLRSLDRRFVLQLQADGDLVLSRAINSERKWSAATKDTGATTLALQEDGNLVLTTPDGKQVWASNTAGRDVTHLFLQTDGNLVLYKDRAALWATSTEER
jgi:hypothetical protein